MGELFPEIIETERLRLEALRPDSVDPFEVYEICAADPGIEAVTRYVTWDPHETPKETLEFLEHTESRREEDSGTTYVVRPRDGEDGAGEIAGMAGFGVDWKTQTMTLGCWLREPFWGRGYSGERAGAFMALAFDRLDLELVAAAAHVDNEQSNRAIEKYTEAHGGGRDGLLRNWETFDGEPADCYRYSVSSAEWEGTASSSSVTFVD